MKKFTAFAVIALTWYISGKYRQPALLLLVNAELLLIVVMFVLPHILKQRLDLQFSEKRQSAHKNTKQSYLINIKNNGYLPVNRIKVKMHFSYDQNSKRHFCKKLFGSAERKSVETLRFNLCAPYCGLIRTQISSFRIYDYVSLFSSKKCVNSETKIYVFPQKRVLDIRVLGSGMNESLDTANHSLDRMGNDRSEIMQVREYRPGDSVRTIHRNYSAKTETLWVKEYSYESEFHPILLLDTADADQVSIEDWDAFYEVLSAVVLGLLGCGVTVGVYWYDQEFGFNRTVEVDDEDQYENMFFQLYNTRFMSGKYARLQFDDNVPMIMSLNLNLEWFMNGTLVFRFSKQSLETELAYAKFIL